MEESAKGIVIAGGGLAAVRTAEELRRLEYTGPITIASNETHLPYDRPPLSKEVLRGERDESTLEQPDFYDEQHIRLRLGAAAVGVDTTARTVALADGTMLGYDKLVIATGLVPRRIPSFPDLEGIRVLRTVDDSLTLRRLARSAQRAVVVGAGFIGCEVTASLRHLGLEVVLVEPQAVPLASVLGEQIGGLVARLHRREGVDLRTGVGVTAVLGDGQVAGAVLSDGSSVSADLVVVGIGAHPQTEWLAGTGIEVDSADGCVVCDAVGRTTAPDVWAVGDIALWQGYGGRRVRIEHWSNVVTQAEVLAVAMLGHGPSVTAPVPYFWSDQYHVKIQCRGEPRPTDIVHLVEDDGEDFLALYERDGVAVGVVGAGMAGRMVRVQREIIARTPIAELLSKN